MDNPANSHGQHTAVLLREVVENFVTDRDGWYVDGTFGRGGHSTAILNALSLKGRLFAFDRDPEAIAYGKENLTDNRLTLVDAPFSTIRQYCQDHALLGSLQGVFVDLGVSSPQLDNGERGFSFMHDGPLDMRMDPRIGDPVSLLLIQLTAETLRDIFRNYGEERHAWKIAQAIKAHLDKGLPLQTTKQLAELISQVIGKREKKHPATRCFQALRIYVNQEFEELKTFLNNSISLLKKGGRLAVISFHSSEDRIVKQFMKNNIVKPSEDRIFLPVSDVFVPKFKWIAKKIRASQTEQLTNVRSRSATLRIVEKL